MKKPRLMLSENFLTAEIFCLGNELLIGRTINRNANEIALELTKVGLIVTRETTVRDEFQLALIALQEILTRKPSVVIITGGLGPTHDDIQLSVVAKALNRPLHLSEEAVVMLEKRYKKHRNEIKENQIKMAWAPQGAEVLKNSEGSAPGSLIDYNGTLVFCLPGVPREMRAILKEGVIPSIVERLRPGYKMYEFGFSVLEIGESTLSEITDEVRSHFPSVAFKTHPRKDNNMYWVQLHVYKLDESETLARAAINEWYSKIKDQFDRKMTDISPIFDENFQAE